MKAYTKFKPREGFTYPKDMAKILDYLNANGKLHIFAHNFVMHSNKVQRCDECIHYDIRYCECTCDSQPQGDIIKNPDDGADCEFFEEDDRD